MGYIKNFTMYTCKSLYIYTAIYGEKLKHMKREW